MGSSPQDLGNSQSKTMNENPISQLCLITTKIMLKLQTDLKQLQ